MVYEMNDLKGILFLVLLKIISITSTNIDCSGNSFHCVNSTHFMICVDIGGGVSITIDDSIIPCPPATMCEQNSRFECEFPKTTTEYPLSVISITRQKETEIATHGLTTMSSYVTVPGIYDSEPKTVTEGVTALANVEVLEAVNLENDTNGKSASGITTISSKTADTQDNKDEITANVKIKTSTHESMFSPNDNLFNVDSVIETVLDKPESQNIVKEILNGNITINVINNNTNNIYETISNKIKFASNSNTTFNIEPKLYRQVVQENVNTSTVNEHQIDNGIQNNVNQNNIQKYPQELSGIINEKIGNDTEITDHDPTTTLSDGLIPLNFNGTPNATNNDQSAIFTITTATEYSVLNETRIVNRNSAATVLANDFTTSQTITEASFTENNLSIDHVTILPTEATNVKDIILNKNQIIESVNQTVRKLNSNIYPTPSTERLASSGTQNIMLSGDQSLTTTVVPLEITTFMSEDANLPISNENNKGALLANEFITTETNLTESKNLIRTLTSEPIFKQDLVLQNSSIKITEMYENAKYVITPNDLWSSSVNVTTTDDVATANPIERYTTNSIITQNVTNYNQSLSSTTPSTTILLETNTSSIPHRNTVAMPTAKMTDIVTSNNQTKTLPTENVHVFNPFKESDHKLKENNTTAGFTYNETTTEQNSSIIPTEMFTIDSSNMQTMTSYDEPVTTATTTETNTNVFVTQSQRRITDEFITTMASHIDRNILTEQVNTVLPDATNIQQKDKIPSDDLLNPSFQNNIHSKVKKNVNDELLSTNKMIEIFMDRGLPTTSTEKSFEFIVNNTEQKDEQSSNNPSPVETSNVKLITDNHHGPIETRTYETNVVTTTTDPYYTENISFTDHVEKLFTEPTNIQDVYSIKNPIIEQINNGKLNLDKTINVTLHYINDPLLNEMSTIEQDAPIPVVTKELAMSSVTQTINISSTPLEKPVPAPITDYSEIKSKDNVLVTTSKGITDNTLFIDETNTSATEDTYYNHTKNQIIPVNQTNPNNLHNQITYKQNSSATLSSSSTNSTHAIVHTTEYGEKLPEETTETIFTESATAIDKVYIETQVEIYRDILNPIVESDNQQQFQKNQERFTNKKTKDVVTGIKNETSIIKSSPLTTESAYNDFIGVTPTWLENNEELQTEKSISVIASTTQHTLQSDDIAALSNIEKFNNFMTPLPMELITDKTNETKSEFNTDSNVELMHNNTATLLSAVVEILNISTSTQLDSSTNKLTVDYLEEIVKTTEVNILEPHADNIIELTTSITQTANPLEISENRTSHTLVSTIPYSSTKINAPTSISSSIELNKNNTSAKINGDLGVNIINSTLNTSATENIAAFQIDLSASNIVKELPIKEKYTTVNPINVSLQVSSGYSDTVDSTLKLETVIETAATTVNSILNSTINTSWVSTHSNPNDHNITDKVFIGTENKPPFKVLSNTSTESSTSKLEGVQNNVIYSESSITTEFQQILQLPARDIKSIQSNQTINSLLNASIDGLSTGTSDSPEYSKIIKNVDTEEIHLTNSTYGPTQDDIGLQISNKMGKEIMDHSNNSIINVNSSEPFHNQGDLKEPVRTADNENASELHNNKQLNNTMNTLNTIVNFVSTTPYSSTTINPSTSISSPTEPNINNTSDKVNSNLGINTSTTENITDFLIDLSATNIVTELPITLPYYTTVNPIDASLPVSSGFSDTVDSTFKFETVTETTAITTDTSISSASRDKSSIQMRSLLYGNIQNSTNQKNKTSNNEMLSLKEIVFVNETTDKSILDSIINTSWVSTHSYLKDYNITDQVFIGTDNKPPVKELLSRLTESSTSRLEDGAENNVIHSELSLTTEPRQIITVPALDLISTDSNQTINSLLNASIDGLSTGTSESPEYSKITNKIDTEEILITNSTYGPTQDDIGLQISNKIGTEIMNYSNNSIINVKSSEPFHNKGDLRDPVRTVNNENASVIYNNKQPDNKINPLNTILNVVSTTPYSSTTINPSTSISSPTEPNINNTSDKVNSDLGINTSTTENITDFLIDLSATNIVTELPITLSYYTTVNPVDVSLPASSGFSDTVDSTFKFETVTETATITTDTSISSASRDKSSIQMSSLLYGYIQNSTNQKNKTSNNEMLSLKKIVFVNETTDNSILDSIINTSWVPNDYNITDQVFIGTDNKPPVKELSSTLTESSTSRLEDTAQNNVIYSESSLTTEPQQILTLSALDLISTERNQTINSLLNAGIDGLSTGTSDSPEYSKIIKNLDTEEILLTNSTYGPNQDDIGLQISNKMGKEIMNHSNNSIINVNSSEPIHNQDNLKEPVRTLNNENASDINNSKQPNNRINSLNTIINFVSTIPYSSSTVNPSTSISSSTKSNINNTSTKTNRNLGINAIDTTLNTSTTENITDFQIDLSASSIATELHITLPYYTTVDVPLQVSSGLSDTVVSTLKYETVTETAATTEKSILNSTIHTSWLSTHSNPNDLNITDKVFIGTENKLPFKVLSNTLTESSTSKLEDGAQNNVIHSESPLTTEPRQILTLPALDIISADSNQTINSSLNASIDGLSTGTSESPECSKITKKIDSEEILLRNSTYGPPQDDIGLQISNKMGTEIMNHSNDSIINVNLSEPFHNKGDLRDPVRTANNENASVIYNKKQPNNTTNTFNTIVNFVSTTPYSSTIINPRTSIFSSTEPNINNTSAQTNSDIGINAIVTTLNTSTTENISDFQIDLSASNIATELHITLPYYTTVNPVDVSLQLSSGLSDTVGNIFKYETVTETAATTIDTPISSALRDEPSIQMSSLLYGNIQNSTNQKYKTCNNVMLSLKKIVFVNETTDNSILDSIINTSWVSAHSNPNDYNITDQVFIGTDNKPPVKELSSTLTESSTSRLEDAAQNNVIYSESSLTTEPQQILTLSALDLISTDSNQTINSLLNAGIDGLSTGTSESPEYSKITKKIDTEEILLTNSTYGATRDDIGPQISNKMGTEIMKHSNNSIINVNSSEPFHNKGDLRDPVRTANNENASVIYNNKQPNNTINTLNTIVNFVSTTPYSSKTINPSTSISSSTEPNINNTSAKVNSDLGINTATTENITDFRIDLSARNIVTELPIKEKYTTVNPIDVSLPVSSGFSDTVSSTLKFEMVTETAATTIDISISSASRDESSIQLSSLLNGNKQNNTNLKNNTSNNEMLALKKIVFVNEATDRSILNSTINTSWVSPHSYPNDLNITDKVFIGKDNKPPVQELSSTLNISSKSRLEDAAQNNVIYSESFLTTESQQILQLPDLDIKSIESNETIKSLLNASIDGLSTGTSEPPESKNLETEEILLTNSTYSTYGPKQDYIGLQISNKMGSEDMNNSSHSNMKVNLPEPLHNHGDLKEPVRTLNNENTVNTKVNIQTNVTVNRNISDKNIVNGFHFSCLNRSRGKYADNNDCRKFYICIGRPQPLAGTCPLNTVFSEINKQCTKNLSHCVRNNQFRCLLEGRFGDFLRDNVYYICIKNSFNKFMRYKLQCLNGFHLNKDNVVCEHNVEVSSSSSGSSVRENSQRSNDNSESTRNSRQNQEASKGRFECEREGKFPHPDDCRKYYVCSKNSKAEYRRKIKHCSSDEVFHNKKKKCIESESHRC